MKFIAKHRKKLVVILFPACVGMILFLSGQSGSQAFNLTYELALPIAEKFYKNPDYDQILAVMIILRKIGRCTAFTMFGGLYYVFVETLAKEMEPKRKWCIILAGIVLFSVFDETHKLLIDGRHCTIEEIIINIVCGFVGCGIFNRVWKRRRR